MRVLGLDISTYTGAVVYDTEAEKVESTKLFTFGMTTKDFRRVQLIANAVGCLCDDTKVDVAVLESLAFGNKFTLSTLTEVQTGIKLQLLARKIPWYQVSPTSLKQWTTGKGNAKKDDMATHVRTRWGFVSTSDDIVDAYALARLGEQLHDKKDATLLKTAKYVHLSA